MLTLLSAVGRSFVRAFLASLVVLLPGILAAPNLNAVKALGVSALIASLASGLKAVQVFVPQLSFARYFGVYGNIVDSFVRAFVGAFLASVLGILNAFDLSMLKSLVVAALVGALAAGVRAVQGFFTQGDVPKPESGLPEPPAVA